MTTCLCVLFVSGTALAHWEVGDSYKMHYPQLPDPCGWDVSFSNTSLTSLADDWQCSESGPVKDIHFWVSFQGSFEPSESFVGPDIHISICADIPAGSEGNEYSLPGGVLWERTFENNPSANNRYEGDFAGLGDQGWLDPFAGVATPNDHTAYYLLNINSIEDPFPQVKDQIYWLQIQLASDPNGYEVGWKTSVDHWNDDAVWLTPVSSWQELYYPESDPLGRGGESIDLAFVITPEPATIALLGFGGLALLRRKRVA